MKNITVTRTVSMPDLSRISLYERAPQFGPNVLFFSGGSALNDISKALKKFTHNSVHLVTPFDSGGSSAVLREAFDILAVGDLRSRLMALADDTLTGNPEIVQLFAYRLPKDKKPKELLEELETMASGKHPLASAIKNPMRKLICNHIRIFSEAMPEGFDLKGASIGNLILVAGYLNNQRQINPVLFMFSKLVNALGNVTPIVNDTMQLAAKLENGETVIGQHNLTGKEVDPLASPIEKLFLVESYENPVVATTSISKKKRKMILDADLICFPPGSFYSSLTANLLPKGVGRSVADAKCPKVYIPSLGVDPERLGMNLDQTIFKLLETLQDDAGQNTSTDRLLNFIFIDSQNGESLKKSTMTKLKREGIHVIDTRLVSESTKPYYDPNLLVIALLSLT